MDLQTPVDAVELVMCIACALMGLSHILHPELWRAYFVRMRSVDKSGVALDGQIKIVPALLIVTLHPVWEGPGVVLTIYGWLLLAKIAVSLIIAPSLGTRSFELARGRGRVLFAGLGLLIISGFSGYALLTP